MTFTGSEDHDIPLSTAAEWTKNYRDSITTGQTIAHYFGGDAIQDIIDQDSCVGLRIYYALDESGNKQLIITGVKANGDDLYQGKLAERSVTCPIDCSAANPLNTD